jgi:hypothetical protein
MDLITAVKSFEVQAPDQFRRKNTCFNVCASMPSVTNWNTTKSGEQVWQKKEESVLFSVTISGVSVIEFFFALSPTK